MAKKKCPPEEVEPKMGKKMPAMPKKPGLPMGGKMAAPFGAPKAPPMPSFLKAAMPRRGGKK